MQKKNDLRKRTIRDVIRMLFIFSPNHISWDFFDKLGASPQTPGRKRTTTSAHSNVLKPDVV